VGSLNDALTLVAVLGIGYLLLKKQQQTASVTNSGLLQPGVPTGGTGNDASLVSPLTGNVVAVVPTSQQVAQLNLPPAGTVYAGTPQAASLPIPSTQFAPTFTGGIQAEVQLPAPGSNPAPISQWLIPETSIVAVDPSTPFSTTLNHIYNALRVYGQGKPADARIWDTWTTAVYNIPPANPVLISGTVDLDTYWNATVGYMRQFLQSQIDNAPAAYQHWYAAQQLQQQSAPLAQARGGMPAGFA
jgi:hypothetical protein